MYLNDDDNSKVKDTDSPASATQEKDAHPSKIDTQSSNPDSARHTSDLARGLALFSQIGISMASCVFLGILLGRWLDERFGTSPWLLLLCTFFGVCAAFVSLNDLAKRNK